MTSGRILTLAVLIAATGCVDGAFDPDRDLLSLHYDHAPDKDDGHSVAADRTVLESLFGAAWIRSHAIVVSGTYGLNRATFNPESDVVMDAAFGDTGWLSAHRNWDATVTALHRRWRTTLEAGGRVWVKEGGQSDLTADVVRALRSDQPDLDTWGRIRVIQHSDWNENQTTSEALAYARRYTGYVRIPDANAYLNRAGGDSAFVEAASAHPIYGAAWRAAFEYYDPAERLDFSDTGELFYLLGLGELGFAAFRSRFLGT